MADQLAPLAAIAESAPAEAVTTGSAPSSEQVVREETKQAVTPGSAPDSKAAPETPADGSAPAEAGEKGTTEWAKLREANRELREREAFLRGQLEATQAQRQQAPQVQVPQQPDLGQFTAQDGTIDWNRYNQAQEAYQQTIIDNKVAQAVEQETKKRIFDDRQSRAAEKDPDIPSKVSVLANSLSRMPNGPTIAKAILESDSGPQVAAYLHDNPGETMRLARLSPLAAAMEIGKLSARINSPTPAPLKPRVSKAPEPINPGGSGSTSPTKDPFEMTMAEHAAHYKGKNWNR